MVTVHIGSAESWAHPRWAKSSSNGQVCVMQRQLLVHGRHMIWRVITTGVDLRLVDIAERSDFGRSNQS